MASHTIHLNKPVVLNDYGKCQLLLDLLYQQGYLPQPLAIYGNSEDTNDLFINGELMGSTESEVTTNIWLMVDRWKNKGYLFE